MGKLEILLNSEEGRFNGLLMICKAKEICMECVYFNKKAKSAYRCRVMSTCIGATLSENVKDYLLKKIN